MKEEPTFTLRECQAEYLCGVAEGKRLMVGSLQPKTVEICIRVRDEKDNIEAINRVVTFEEIKESGGKVLRYECERTLAEIATQGIIKSLIENS